MSKRDYRSIAEEAQRSLQDSIPAKWRLTSRLKLKDSVDLRPLIAKSNILSPEQLAITELTASEIVNEISSGRLTAVKVTEAFTARAAIATQLVNCLVKFYPEKAIEEASILDEIFAQTGEIVGPLHGVPIAIKDIMEVKGEVTTLGLTSWYDNPPAEEDAVLVKVMRTAGAVIFGRTAMPQVGMALETVSWLWSRTVNPFNSTFGAGGSSGGDGALVAMRGAPIAPLSTDIGGSIRAPAAFNGLYGMRPTSERTPRTGAVAPVKGNVSIKSSTGPCCHSMDDLKLAVKLILTHPDFPNEPSCSVPYWTEETKPRYLRVGFLISDGVVDAHPPIMRAMMETANKLRAAGHEVAEFPVPSNMWEAALTTWALYFQTGAQEATTALEATGEPPIAQFARCLEIFKTREITVPELFAHNRDQAAYKAEFAKAWDETAALYESEEPVDCIICPVNPMAGVPNDTTPWWGYTSMWNLLDYPSIVLPIKDLEINAVDDPKDMGYRPRDNPFDEENWEIYDPVRWQTQPVTLQIVGRPWKDERLIAVCETLDEIVNGK